MTNNTDIVNDYIIYLPLKKIYIQVIG